MRQERRVNELEKAGRCPGIAHRKAANKGPVSPTTVRDAKFSPTTVATRTPTCFDGPDGALPLPESAGGSDRRFVGGLTRG